MTYQYAASTRWTVEACGITLVNPKTGKVCALTSPQAAIWDLLTRSYAYDQTVRMIMKYLLDSNIISDFYDKFSSGHSKISKRLGSLTDADRVYISILTLYEAVQMHLMRRRR